MTFEDNTTTERPTFVTHLECGMTGTQLPADTLHQLSPEGWPLLVKYNLEALRAAVSKEDLSNRTADFWRYREFLPVRKAENIVSLGEIMTPLMPLSRSVPKGATVLVKDEGRLPTLFHTHSRTLPNKK